MIKTKINNEYKGIIKIFGGGALQKEITKVWSKEANKYVYESSVEYTGTLPITINADGSALLDYRIYGNSEQAGTPTPENPIMPEGVGERVDIAGLSAPLCGIGMYTDSLDLSTGTLTRRIKKLVLTGEENWDIRTGSPSNVFFIEFYSTNFIANKTICTHYINQDSGKFDQLENEHCLVALSSDGIRSFIGIRDSSYSATIYFKLYLQQQYAVGTPVTIWYVLAEPEVSTILVPSGMAGTIEGYLIQDGTPTPETPIYPITNGIKQADGTYSIEYGYKLPMVSRTENLFDISMVEQGGWSASAGTIPIKLEPENPNYPIRTRYNRIIPLLATTMSLYCPSNIKINYVWIDANGISLGGTGFQKNGDTVTAPEQAVFMTFILGLDGDINCTPNDFYDITIVAGSTVTNIYLGEVESTRRIHKMRLVNPSRTTNTTEGYRLDFPIAQHPAPNYQSGTGICNITRWNANYREVGFVASDDTVFITQNIAEWATKEGATEWLDEHEVYVWYVLANEETGIVNEPLMKIGDYADTISMEQADVNIPTFAGTTAIGYNGEPKPSQMYIKYRR